MSATPRGEAERADIAGVTRAHFGHAPDGTPVDVLTLTGARGITMRVLTYGGIIASLHVPDRAGRMDDIVLGHDDLMGYARSDSYFGAIVGRVGNRIASGMFTLDGDSWQLATNDGPNHLHGGVRGFDKVVWTAEPFRGADGPGVALSYTSADGEEGYPGTLEARVTYALTDAGTLVVDYEATTDRATPVNLTQHTYFNLAGAGSGDILAHELTLHASRYTPVDATLIPTGALAPVEGTPFDFRRPTAIGARIAEPDPQLRRAKGYDHNFVLDGTSPGALVHAARLRDPGTGRVLDVHTTEPGVQFYSGNLLDGVTGKGGRTYGRRGALCLETQHFPDSVHHPAFPSVVLRPGETYRSRTVFGFGTDGE